MVAIFVALTFIISVLVQEVVHRYRVRHKVYSVKPVTQITYLDSKFGVGLTMADGGEGVKEETKKE